MEGEIDPFMLHKLLQNRAHVFYIVISLTRPLLSPCPHLFIDDGRIIHATVSRRCIHGARSGGKDETCVESAFSGVAWLFVPAPGVLPAWP